MSGAYDAEVVTAVAGARPNYQGWLRGRCPLCPIEYGKPDRQTSLAVHSVSGVYKCFRCGGFGRVDPDLLGGQVGAVLDPGEAPPYLGPPEGYTALWEPAGAWARCLEPARAFLRARGILDGLWAAAGIGATAVGRYAGRVIIPVLSRTGEWRGWVGRAWVDGAERPYDYPWGMPRGEDLYNGRVLDVETDAPALCVEGALDAVVVGLDASSAFLGSPGGPGSEHYAALRRARRPVCIVLDGDAWRAGWALAFQLRLDGSRAGAIRLGPRVDPDEVPGGVLRAAAVESLSTWDAVEV